MDKHGNTDENGIITAQPGNPSVSNTASDTEPEQKAELAVADGAADGKKAKGFPKEQSPELLKTEKLARSALVKSVTAIFFDMLGFVPVLGFVLSAVMLVISKSARRQMKKAYKIADKNDLTPSSLVPVSNVFSYIARVLSSFILISHIVFTVLLILAVVLLVLALITGAVAGVAAVFAYLDSIAGFISSSIAGSDALSAALLNLIEFTEELAALIAAYF